MYESVIFGTLLVFKPNWSLVLSTHCNTYTAGCLLTVLHNLRTET